MQWPFIRINYVTIIALVILYVFCVDLPKNAIQGIQIALFFHILEDFLIVYRPNYG
jgi:membrane-bound metal-dependent hydrolase YbcI (DUF457 family)